VRNSINSLWQNSQRPKDAAQAGDLNLAFAKQWNSQQPMTGVEDKVMRTTIYTVSDYQRRFTFW